MPTFRKDRSATIKFTSMRELTKEEREILLEAGVSDEQGWLLWSPNKLQLTDIPDRPAMDEKKSPAERQRAVLFLQWKQKGQQGSFEEYYSDRMSKIIDHLKSQLEQDI